MNLTTIIPVHEYNKEVEELLNGALDSVAKQDGIDDVDYIPVIIVYAASIEKEIKKFVDGFKGTKAMITAIKNDGNTDFQSQINLGAENTSTEWFSILEFDDEFSITYYKNVLHHIKKLENVDLIIPILLEVNENDDPLKMTNETVWSKQFVGENGEMGYLNAVALNQYTDFKISGGIFKKSEFQGIGGLKSNIKLTFTYELLLRMLNNGSNIYTMPKIGVKHFTTREGSLFDVYNQTMSIQDRKFWFDTAKKESNFFNDRVIDMSLLTKEEA